MIYLRIFYGLLVIFGSPFLFVRLFEKAKRKHPIYMILTAILGTLLIFSAIFVVAPAR